MPLPAVVDEPNGDAGFAPKRLDVVPEPKVLVVTGLPKRPPVALLLGVPKVLVLVLVLPNKPPPPAERCQLGSP